MLWVGVVIMFVVHVGVGAVLLYACVVLKVLALLCVSTVRGGGEGSWELV